MPSKNRTKFLGPTQSTFPNFNKLSISSSNTFCPRWNNYGNPASYSIPPVFYYKNPHKPDHELAEIDSCKSTNAAFPSDDRLLIDRGSDDAERTVFDALNTLIHERFQGPILVLHNFNINRIRGYLSRIFPGFEWKDLTRNLTICFEELMNQELPSIRTESKRTLVDALCAHLRETLPNANGESSKFKEALKQFFGEHASLFPDLAIGDVIPKMIDRLSDCFNSHFREFDFVVIGPKVGIVVIEVKHSGFSKDFASKNEPRRFKDGIDQLRAFDHVLGIVDAVTKVKADLGCVRKVLFAPNLERTRFDGWMASLEENNRERVRELLNGIDCWFSESTLGGSSLEGPHATSPIPLLCDKFRNYLSVYYDFPIEVFESHAPILVGLSSVTVSKNKLDIDSLNLSESESTLKESHRVDTQDSLLLLQRASSVAAKQPKVSLPKDTVELWKVMILTPDQATANSGPSRQFIVGAAGSGKTVVLQSKALYALRKGESVLVLSPRSYIARYIDLFETHGSDKNLYSVLSWRKMRTYLQQDLNFARLLETFSSKTRVEDECRRFILDCLGDEAKRKTLVEGHFKHLIKYDHILIDDTFDEDPGGNSQLEEASLVLCLRIMAFSAEARDVPWKSVWVAMDPYASQSYYSIFGNNFTSTLDRLFKETDQVPTSTYFAVSHLKYIMRCPENVYDAVYHPNFSPNIARPSLGHKVQGLRSAKTVTTYEELWNEVQLVLFDETSGREKFARDQVVIILSNVDSMATSTRDFFLRSLNDRNVPCGFVEIEQRDPIRVGDNLAYVCDVEHDFAADNAEGIDFSRGKIMVYNWNQVSSLEWPVVIYVDESVGQSYRNVHDHKYRACTRATGRLVELYFKKDFGQIFASLGQSGAGVVKA